MDSFSTLQESDLDFDPDLLDDDDQSDTNYASGPASKRRKLTHDSDDESEYRPTDDESESWMCVIRCTLFFPRPVSSKLTD